MENALEMGIAHPDRMHMVKRVLDVIHASTPLSDALRHQARSAVEIELPDVGGMAGICEERERPDLALTDPDAHRLRLIDPARHLAHPQARQRSAEPARLATECQS